MHCDGENDERDNAHANCRCEPVEGKAESGDAGQDGRDEEELRPTFHPVAAQPAAELNETGKNPDQAGFRTRKRLGPAIRESRIAFEFTAGERQSRARTRSVHSSWEGEMTFLANWIASPAIRESRIAFEFAAGERQRRARTRSVHSSWEGEMTFLANWHIGLDNRSGK